MKKNTLLISLVFVGLFTLRLNEAFAQTSAQSWMPSKNLDVGENKIVVSLRLLNRPIGFDPHKKKVLFNDAILDQNSKAGEYYSQGLFEIFTYNWVDAIRSLKASIKENPNFLPAYLALVEPYISSGAEDYLLPLFKHIESTPALMAALKDKSHGEVLTQWLKLSKILGCRELPQVCELLPRADLIALMNDQRGYIEAKSKELSELALEKNLLDIAVFAQNHQWNREVLEKVISKFPNHIGARHYLVHLSENRNRYEEAVGHAKIIAEIAPDSAHSQHMYGHVLPKLGRWTEAIQQFERANKIHRDWLLKNQATPNEDWHFPHNLDLLAHAYYVTSQFEKAESIRSYLCKTFGWNYCLVQSYFLIARNNLKEARAVIQPYEDLKVFMVPILNFLEKPRDLKAQQELVFAAGSYRDFSPLIVFTTIMASMNRPEDSSFRKVIANKVEYSLNNGGFDSWSMGSLLADLYIRGAEVTDNKTLAADLRLIKAQAEEICRQRGLNKP